MTILITRPQPDADRLAKILKKNGYMTLVDPLLKIEFIGEQITFEPGQAFLTTSLNGIRALAKLFSGRNILLYTVGQGSANEAQAMGFQNVKCACGNSKALVRKIRRDLSPLKGPLIYVCGDVVRGNMIETLANHGFEVKKKVIYRTEEAPKFAFKTLRALKTGKISAALFFSPRTAEIFVKLLFRSSLERVCETMTSLCLSQAVADTLKCLPWKAVKVAAAPSTQALLAQIYNRTL